jgi:hypothetical protein
VRRFPTYHPLYSAMLQTLMPRWGGSIDAVDSFIRETASLSPSQAGYAQLSRGPDLALYARLYWMYSSLESDEIDIFKDAHARWELMRPGFTELLRLHPGSDFVLNGFAKLACIAGDSDTYGQLRPQLSRHVSATAWSKKITLAGCDMQMKALEAPRHTEGAPKT